VVTDTVAVDTDDDDVVVVVVADDDDDDVETNLKDHMRKSEEEGPSLPSQYFENVMSTPIQRKHFVSLQFHSYGYDSSVTKTVPVSYYRLAWETVVSVHFRIHDEALIVAVAELASHKVVVVSDTHHHFASTDAELEEVHAEVEAEETPC